MPKLFLPRATLVSLLLASAACCFAADELPPPPPEHEQPPGDVGPGQFDRLFGELREARIELKLTREQELAWLEADRISRAVAAASRQGRERLLASLMNERDKDIIDFVRLSKEYDEVSTEMQRQRAQARDKWLAVYRCLSNEQKGLVSRRVRERMTRMRALYERGRKELPPPSRP